MLQNQAPVYSFKITIHFFSFLKYLSIFSENILAIFSKENPKNT